MNDYENLRLTLECDGLLTEKFPTEEECVYVNFYGGSYSEGYRIIWRRDGQWYDAEDDHCSCNGFGGFMPYEVTEGYVKRQAGHLGFKMPEAN